MQLLYSSGTSASNSNPFHQNALNIITEDNEKLQSAFQSFQQSVQAQPVPMDTTGSTPSVTFVSDQTMISPTPDMLNAAGVAARNNRHYQEAFKLFQQAAQKQHPEAMHQIGSLYYCGLGVKEDVEQAITWFWKAERLGFAPAKYFLCQELGNRYWNARDLPQDEAQSRDQLEELAKSGDVAAMNKLGMLEQKVYQYQDALKWYQQAADLGDPAGMSNLGYVGITFCNWTMEEARPWFEQAAQKGNAYALFQLCIFEKNNEKEHEYLERATQLGCSEAIKHLARNVMYESDQLDQEKSVLLDKYYRILLDLGDIEGAVKVMPSTLISDEEQERHYQRAADLNNFTAIERLVSKCRNAPSGRIKEAFNWYGRMIDMRESSGYSVFVTWYQSGELSKDDSVKLLNELKGAVGQGDAWAFDALVNCVSTPEDMHGIKMQVSELDLSAETIDSKWKAQALAELLITDKNIVSLKLDIGQEWIPDFIPVLKVNNTLKELHLSTDDENEDGKVCLSSDRALVEQLESIQACCPGLTIITDDKAVNNRLKVVAEFVPIEKAQTDQLREQVLELILCAKEVPFELIQIITNEMTKRQAPAQKMYSLGMSKRQKGFYNEAIACFMKVIEKHMHSQAAYQLGLMLLFGLGIEKNSENAICYFELALEWGFAPANRRLSVELKNIHWNKQDLSPFDSMAQLTQQALSDDVVSLNRLGALHQRQGSAMAVMYYFQAAQKGDPAGMSNYGHLLQYGLGVPVDIKQARVWYKKAAASGNVYATYRLGELAHQEKNYGEAHQWLGQADALNTPGFSAAAELLGTCYLYGQGVEHNLQKALEWYGKAAKLGSSSAYLQLAYIHQELKNISKMLENYTIAADLGEPDALFRLVDINWMEKEYTRALENLHLAADIGHAYANVLLANLYRKGGEGIEQNQQKADHYGQRALEYGNPNEFFRFVDAAKQPDDIRCIKMRVPNFNLGKKELNQKQVTYLATLLAVDQTIKVLVLNISEAELPNFLEGLRGNQTLQTIHLTMTTVSDESMEILHKIYQQSGVQSITTTDDGRALLLKLWGAEKLLRILEQEGMT